MPLDDRFKGGGPAQIKHNHGSDCILVIDVSHVSKAFVPRNVPQLQFDAFAFVLQRLEREVHPYCQLVVGAVVALRVAPDNGGLAHAVVANHQHLVELTFFTLCLHLSENKRKKTSCCDAVPGAAGALGVGCGDKRCRGHSTLPIQNTALPERRSFLRIPGGPVVCLCVPRWTTGACADGHWLTAAGGAAAALRRLRRPALLRVHRSVPGAKQHRAAAHRFPLGRSLRHWRVQPGPEHHGHICVQQRHVQPGHALQQHFGDGTGRSGRGLRTVPVLRQWHRIHDWRCGAGRHANGRRGSAADRTVCLHVEPERRLPADTCGRAAGPVAATARRNLLL
eukprot:m.200655 g.200655  ORF g.200655 m.200655 type:complete len:337 (+) comp21920_c1_seq1:354-1364(+)